MLGNADPGAAIKPYPYLCAMILQPNRYWAMKDVDTGRPMQCNAMQCAFRVCMNDSRRGARAFGRLPGAPATLTVSRCFDYVAWLQELAVISIYTDWPSGSADSTRRNSLGDHCQASVLRRVPGFRDSYVQPG